MDGHVNEKELRHDRHTALISGSVWQSLVAELFPWKCRKWREVFERYIETKDQYHAKNAMYRPRP